MTTKTKGLHRKHSLIAEHYDGFVDKMLVRRKGVPDYYYQLNADQNEKNELIMQSMNTKINYLKNPRYKKDRAPIEYADLITGTMRDPTCPFRADPEVILFEDYSLNEIYSISMTLVNSDKVLRRVKFIPPSSGEFSIANVIYPTVETGLIAPGNHVVFEIFFKANSLADYDDELIIITEENNFRIPLLARREQPDLDLKGKIECNSCWIGQDSVTKLEVTNNGGVAGFWFIDSPEEAKTIPDQYRDAGEFIREDFTIFPNKFYLRKGQKCVLNTRFFPKKDGFAEVGFTLACDNLRTYCFSLQAEANMIEL